MPSNVQKLVWDALDAARGIQADVRNIDFGAFDGDGKTQASVNWRFAVIGEAMRRIRNQFAEDAKRIRNVDSIIAFRNVLVHGYDVIDNIQVWRTIHEHLPELIDDLEAMMEHHD